MIVLVHHADAVSESIDTQRPLSRDGQAHAARLAADAAGRGVRPEAIRHSGKLRARQTADAFRAACNPLAEFSAARGLQPADPPAVIAGELNVEARDVLVVGHMPNLDRVHELMLSRSTGPARHGFPLHGLVVLERDENNAWREAWRLT